MYETDPDPYQNETDPDQYQNETDPKHYLQVMKNQYLELLTLVLLMIRLVRTLYQISASP